MRSTNRFTVDWVPKYSSKRFYFVNTNSSLKSRIHWRRKNTTEQKICKHLSAGMQIHSTQCFRESLPLVIKEYALLKQCQVSTPLYFLLVVSVFVYSSTIFIFLYFMFKDRREMVREHIFFLLVLRNNTAIKKTSSKHSVFLECTNWKKWYVYSNFDVTLLCVCVCVRFWIALQITLPSTCY